MQKPNDGLAIPRAQARTLLHELRESPFQSLAAGRFLALPELRRGEGPGDATWIIENRKSITHQQALEVIAREWGYQDWRWMVAVAKTRGLRCRKCDQPLTTDAFCSQEACIYGNFRQNAKEADIREMPLPWLSRRYGYDCRLTEGGAVKPEYERVEVLVLGGDRAADLPALPDPAATLAAFRGFVEQNFKPFGQATLDGPAHDPTLRLHNSVSLMGGPLYHVEAVRVRRTEGGDGMVPAGTQVADVRMADPTGMDDDFAAEAVLDDVLNVVDGAAETVKLAGAEYVLWITPATD